MSRVLVASAERSNQLPSFGKKCNCADSIRGNRLRKPHEREVGSADVPGPRSQDTVVLRDTDEGKMLDFVRDHATTAR